MIKLLASLFIKDRENYTSPAVRQSYGTLCGAVGIGLNILLFLGKWIAGFLSGSIAITYGIRYHIATAFLMLVR